MLVLLTGNRQVGKTRLLEAVLDKASEAGARCVGLITPGIWERGHDGKLNKLGIDALLLPQRKKMPFALKRDGNEAAASSSQSDSAKLGWMIFDDSIDAINAHFDELAKAGIGDGDLIVVDELGTLELVHGKGLTSALALLGDPAIGCLAPNTSAVVVVRPELIEVAKKRFAPVWGEPLVVDASGKDADFILRNLS